MDIEKLTLSKPKKSINSTYVCRPTEPLEIKIKNAHVISNADNVVHIKASKSTYDSLASLSERIIEIVKENCTKWFNTSMSDDLIEEYFCYPIVYSNKHGDLIRLKLSDEPLNVVAPPKQRTNVSLTLENIRIFKQKFVMEWHIDCSTPDSDAEISEDDTDEIDIPFDEIKETYHSKLQDRISELQDRLDQLLHLQERLNSSDESTLPKICDSIDIFVSDLSF